MKAFKKWLAKQKQFYNNRKGVVEKGWRGALEHVKEFADSETCARIDEELLE